MNNEPNLKEEPRDERDRLKALLVTGRHLIAQAQEKCQELDQLCASRKEARAKGRQRAVHRDTTDSKSSSSRTKLLIAVVDDEAAVCRSLRRLLLSADFDCETFISGQDFLQNISMRQPDCLLLDWLLPGLTGSDVLSRLKVLGTKFPVIVITGSSAPGLDQGILALGASALMRLPVDDQELLEVMNRAIT